MSEKTPLKSSIQAEAAPPRAAKLTLKQLAGSKRDLRAHVGAERADCLVQTATFLVNDACRAPDVTLCYAPRMVALSCAHAAGLAIGGADPLAVGARRLRV